VELNVQNRTGLLSIWNMILAVKENGYIMVIYGAVAVIYQ
jgi:hypothetical protein